MTKYVINELQMQIFLKIRDKTEPYLMIDLAKELDVPMGKIIGAVASLVKLKLVIRRRKMVGKKYRNTVLWIGGKHPNFYELCFVGETEKAEVLNEDETRALNEGKEVENE